MPQVGGDFRLLSLLHLLDALPAAAHKDIGPMHFLESFLYYLGYDVSLCLPLSDPQSPLEIPLLVDIKPLPRNMAKNQQARRCSRDVTDGTGLAHLY